MSQRSKINASSERSSRFAAVAGSERERERERAREIRKADGSSNILEIEHKSRKKSLRPFTPVSIEVLPKVVNPTANAFLIFR